VKRIALQLEHKFKNRLVGVHLIAAHQKMATLGTSRSADIHLLGEEVSGLHAAFEVVNDRWVLSDLGSESGTWIHKKPIVEAEIEGATVIHIGSHQLKATPHILDQDLFAKPSSSTKEGELFHQVIVLRNGLVFRSILLPPAATYELEFGEIKQTLSAPLDDEWKNTVIGNVIIKQRLTRASAIKESPQATISRSIEPGVHGPLISAIVIFFLVFIGFLMAPSQPKDEMKVLTPEMQNQFTRMIFDGQKNRAKKIQAEKYQKILRGQNDAGVTKLAPGGDQGTQKPGGAKTVGARVINNLKAAGLGALIGKISKRASKNALLLQASGVAPDAKGSGRALGLGGGGALDQLGGGKAAGGAVTQKINGIGTLGKGGGSSDYKGSGALAKGSVGTAEVGIIEEETQIDGGLDKDAIAKVIHSQLGQIRYCYERQLSASPDLYGKILVKFTIGATGAVLTQAIGNSSLNNAMVEGCILRRIAGWQFPLPKGGTNVVVTYPFLFKSTR
jgi:pSer/pThr/pTyr-binding forkhead associated (FHA) protein